jgi:predicted GNAT superfamily acetyltransferase
MKVEIGPIENSGVVMEINNSAIPDVNELSADKARWLVENSLMARLIKIDGRPAGVIIVLDEQASLDSDYYRWFVERYRNFVYIDRVIVSEQARGLGLATKLYWEVEKVAQETGRAIAADVYCEPANAPSLTFHQKLGYQEVGQQFCQQEGKTVAKLMKYPERVETVVATYRPDA